MEEETNKNKIDENGIKNIKDIKKGKENLDRFFSKRPKGNLTMGMEVELFLWDKENDRLVDDEDLIHDILQELPIEITRDYYPYQLEIRTRPHKNPNDLIKDFVKSLELCKHKFYEYNIKIIPLSWLGGGENFCGVHFHIRNGHATKFSNTISNSYPFILALTDCFKNSYKNDNELSWRIINSQHIALPNIMHPIRSNRFSDIAINRNRENSRHRLKSENTVEIRTFDVPHNITYMANLVHLMFNLYNYIVVKEKIEIFKFDSKIFENIMEYNNAVYSAFCDTRQDLRLHRNGYNFCLDMYNTQIYEYLCEKFKIPKLIVPCALSIPLSLRANRKRGVNDFLEIKEKEKSDKPKEEKIKRKKKISDNMFGAPPTYLSEEEYQRMFVRVGDGITSDNMETISNANNNRTNDNRANNNRV